MSTPSPPSRAAVVLLGIAVALGATAGLLERTLTPHGATLSVFPQRGFEGRAASPTVAVDSIGWPDPDVSGVEAGSLLWTTLLDVPTQDTYVLAARGEGAVRLSLDGATLVQADDGTRQRRELELGPGLHLLEVGFHPADPASALRVAWARQGERARPFAPTDLYVSTPGVAESWTRPLARASRWLAAILALAGLSLLARPMLRHDRTPRIAAAIAGLRRRLEPVRPWLPALAATGITAYAAALRFEALVGRFWHDAPPWARAIEAVVRGLRPAGMGWRPKPAFEGDPFSYLTYARAMEWFYDAHVREPLFVFSTRVALGLVGGHDVAVGLASAFYSTLMVVATWLLGRRLGGPTVGLLAAGLLAIEPHVISLSVEGWRDDAFSAGVVLFAWAVLLVHDEPTRPRALVLGSVAGLACLTRITSLSYIVPALIAVAVLGNGTRRARLHATATAGLMTAALVGPFLLSCAIAFGDPLYSINDHTRFFRARRQLDHETGMSVAEYLASTLRPVELTDNLLVGLTSYPFTSKWEDFGTWSPLLPWMLPPLAIAGLGWLALSARGRLLLVVLASSLVPYAFTWNVRGGGEWRFTLHAYPFYLVAAGLLVRAVVPLLTPSGVRRVRALGERPRRVAVTVAAAGLVVLAALAGAHGLAWLRARESVRAGSAATVAAGARDALFFGDGWHRPVRLGNNVVRFSDGRRAELSLPMRAGQPHRLTFRIDPFVFDGAPEQVLRLALDDQPLGELHLGWDPRRIGTYTVEVPAALVPHGTSAITLEASSAASITAHEGGFQDVAQDGETSFLLWYVTVEPRVSSVRR